ncbi:hypothetical protein AAE478_001322 [Parahypoxylon ruwenzoriense]
MSSRTESVQHHKAFEKVLSQSSRSSNKYRRVLELWKFTERYNSNQARLFAVDTQSTESKQACRFSQNDDYSGIFITITGQASNDKPPRDSKANSKADGGISSDRAIPFLDASDAGIMTLLVGGLPFACKSQPGRSKSCQQDDPAKTSFVREIDTADRLERFMVLEECTKADIEALTPPFAGTEYQAWDEEIYSHYQQMKIQKSAETPLQTAFPSNDGVWFKGIDAEELTRKLQAQPVTQCEGRREQREQIQEHVEEEIGDEGDEQMGNVGVHEGEATKALPQIGDDESNAMNTAKRLLNNLAVSSSYSYAAEGLSQIYSEDETQVKGDDNSLDVVMASAPSYPELIAEDAGFMLDFINDIEEKIRERKLKEDEQRKAEEPKSRVGRFFSYFV